MTARLTKMQRRILLAMKQDEIGFAAFTGEQSRRYGYGEAQARHGGIIFRAYSHPEYFLKQRGLIEPHDRNVPGRWYRLTDVGRGAIS